jgi:hypothetical protein
MESAQRWLPERGGARCVPPAYFPRVSLLHFILGDPPFPAGRWSAGYDRHDDINDSSDNSNKCDRAAGRLGTRISPIPALLVPVGRTTTKTAATAQILRIPGNEGMFRPPGEAMTSMTFLWCDFWRPRHTTAARHRQSHSSPLTENTARPSSVSPTRQKCRTPSDPSIPGERRFRGKAPGTSASACRLMRAERSNRFPSPSLPALSRRAPSASLRKQRLASKGGEVRGGHGGAARQGGHRSCRTFGGATVTRCVTNQADPAKTVGAVQPPLTGMRPFARCRLPAAQNASQTSRLMGTALTSGPYPG